MTWVRVDDKIHEHDKFRNLTGSAIAIWFVTVSWSADHRTDGYIPNEVAREKVCRHCRGHRLSKIAGELVKAGLWVIHDGGFLIHDFAEYNRTSVDREADRLRKEAERIKKKDLQPEIVCEPPDSLPITSREPPASLPRASRGKTAGQRDVSRTCPAPPNPNQNHTQETSSLVPLTATPSRGLAIVPDPGEINAGHLIAAWIDHRGGVAPAPRIMGQISREIRSLLEAKITPNVIYEGLINWQESGYAPSALSSFVDRALVHPSGVNVPKKIGSRTDQMLSESLDTLAWAREQDRKAQGELA